MKLSELTVEVRNSTLARVGQISDADLVGLELALRFNRVGAWRITLRADHPLVDTLRQPGSGLVVTGPNGVLISGPTLTARQSKTAEDPVGTWEIVGTDDSIVLGERLAYPTPTSDSLAAQTSAYDTRTGKAETVAKAFVTANIGASAPASRKIAALSVGTDIGRGNTVSVSARFDKLGELIYGTLTPSGLGFDIKQSGSSLVFDVFTPTDRSSYVRMDVDNLRLSKSEYSYAAPGATRVIVAGQGQGEDRTFVERTSTASLAAETSWGRRIEVFKDQRNTDVTAELQAAGDEILAERGFTIEGISVTPSDDLYSMRYGNDWNLGDKVTVVVGTAEVAKVVTEVAIVVTEDGLKVGATVGEPDIAASGTESAVVSAQTSQEARISNLERNDVSGGGGASVLVADVAPSGAADNSLWWNSGNGSEFIRYNDGDSAQWVEMKSPAAYVAATQLTSLTSRVTALENTKNEAAARWVRQIFHEVDTADRSFGTSWALAYTGSLRTGFRAGSLIRFRYHLPLRNDSSGWGGAYIEPEITYNDSTWLSLGTTGHDGNVMEHNSWSIGTYNNVILINPVLDGVTGPFSFRFRFRVKSYDGTLWWNMNHDLTGRSGVVPLAAGANAQQHYANFTIEELALIP